MFRLIALITTTTIIIIIIVTAAQEQALNTNSVRKIYHKDVSKTAGYVCGIHVENVLHIVSGCSILAQKEYKEKTG